MTKRKTKTKEKIKEGCNMGKGNKQYYEFSNYIEETNNEHDSKNKIKIVKILIP